MVSRFSCVRLFETLWTVFCQALLSMVFSRQEYWSGVPCPPPGGLPHPGMEPTSLASLALQAASGERLKDIKASFPTSENFALTSGVGLGIIIDMLKNLPSDTNMHQELRISALWVVGLSGDNYQNDVS